jgi:uncharacterized protein (TIGR02452 family)
MDLKKIADETKAELPNALGQLPTFDAKNSSIYDLKDQSALDANDCPSFALSDSDGEAGKKGTRIQVWDMDTFDAAILLAPDYKAATYLRLSLPSTGKEDSNQINTDQTMKDSADEDEQPSTTTTTPTRPQKPVAVLNLASERSAGGGWQNGALAQEEALCYRSSLYLSLHTTHYPLPPLSALYTPHVVLIRSALSQGHTLLFPATPARDLPATSVITLAGLKHPKLTNDNKYADPADEDTTRDKIRISLRVAAHQGHTKLVLGALGCGVFGNPAKEVARLFLDVLCEEEFRGGWWSDVVFAVMDNGKRGEKGRTNGDGNYGVFWRSLDGQVV